VRWKAVLAWFLIEEAGADNSPQEESVSAPELGCDSEEQLIDGEDETDSEQGDLPFHDYGPE
jgi:hypothetical protein